MSGLAENFLHGVDILCSFVIKDARKEGQCLPIKFPRLEAIQRRMLLIYEEFKGICTVRNNLENEDEIPQEWCL